MAVTALRALCLLPAAFLLSCTVGAQPDPEARPAPEPLPFGTPRAAAPRRAAPPPALDPAAAAEAEAACVAGLSRDRGLDPSAIRVTRVRATPRGPAVVMRVRATDEVWACRTGRTGPVIALIPRRDRTPRGAPAPRPSRDGFAAEE